jgi:hypothetical protein
MSSIDGWGVFGLVMITVLLFVFVSLPLLASARENRAAREAQPGGGPELLPGDPRLHATTAPEAPPVAARPDPDRELVGSGSTTGRHRR